MAAQYTAHDLIIAIVWKIAARTAPLCSAAIKLAVLFLNFYFVRILFAEYMALKVSIYVSYLLPVMFVFYKQIV